jgi:hypothetical protein
MIRIVVGIVAVLSLPLGAVAQGRTGDGQPETRLKLPTAAALAAANPDRPAAMGWTSEMASPAKANGGSLPPTIQTRHRSIGRKILGGALGAVGGFFAGGYLGAKIEGDSCNCDDPGLKGALIGAPIGAVTGGILGAMFF